MISEHQVLVAIGFDESWISPIVCLRQNRVREASNSRNCNLETVQFTKSLTLK
jgi:hypothetical protein